MSSLNGQLLKSIKIWKTKSLSMGGGVLGPHMVVWLAMHLLETAVLEVDVSLRGMPPQQKPLTLLSIPFVRHTNRCPQHGTYLCP